MHEATELARSILSLIVQLPIYSDQMVLSDTHLVYKRKDGNM